MMRQGPTLKATAKRRVSRGLMVVREARCVSLSPVSRLARIGAVWSALVVSGGQRSLVVAWVLAVGVGPAQMELCDRG